MFTCVYVCVRDTHTHTTITVQLLIRWHGKSNKEAKWFPPDAARRWDKRKPAVSTQLCFQTAGGPGPAGGPGLEILPPDESLLIKGRRHAAEDTASFSY